MHTTPHHFLYLSLFSILLACQSAPKNKATNQQEVLKKLMEEKQNISNQIEQIQSTMPTNENNAIVVSVTPIQYAPFYHAFDLIGNAVSDSIYFITPAYGPGQVTHIYIKKGDYIHKGQLLLSLKKDIIQQNVNALQQNVNALSTQAKEANDLYQRQSALWKQGIGTEVQYNNAKTNMEVTALQVKSALANLQQASLQLAGTEIHSEVTGIVNSLNIQVGETFIGNGEIQVINTNIMKGEIQIPENYLGQVSVGTPVLIDFTNKQPPIRTTVSYISSIINPNNQSFLAEVRLQGIKYIKANEELEFHIINYSNPKAIILPINCIQNDENGKFVFVSKKNGAQYIAVKQPITVGYFYNTNIEVTSGLHLMDSVIVSGYQNVYDGLPIQIK